MCGIWLYLQKQTPKGSISKSSKLSKGELYQAFFQISGRGPERSHFIELEEYKLCLGFHRLSIMDTSTKGDQPFVLELEDRIIYVICNGEIYNFKKLCREFQITTNSGSDCEVLGFLFEKIGIEKMIDRLIGEFAFCICELNKLTHEVKVYVGRDQAGIRPLFITGNDDEIVLTSEMKGSPFLHLGYRIEQFEPRSILCFSNLDDSLFPEKIRYEKYINFENISTTITDLEIAKQRIKDSFIEAVEVRMNSDRPIGVLLSGGLDSSLVSSIASQFCQIYGSELHSFSIGMESGSTDEYYANKVSEHIGSIHHHITFTEQEWLGAVNTVIRVIESYDVTTVRASTGQYLISKWISEHTNIKVLLIGDGSDELCSGYMYFHKCPTSEMGHQENIRLVNDIHMFDVLRADRGISFNGLEARVPFLDTKFITTYLSIDPKLRIPNGIEKWLLREAFRMGSYLPDEVLNRQKEAFSDGVSSLKRSWYSILQENINEKISDFELENAKIKYKHCPPMTKEALYFRKIFEEYFGDFENTAKVIPYYWLPKWVGEISEPSARILEVYKN